MSLVQNHINKTFNLNKCVAAFFEVCVHFAPKDSLFEAYLVRFVEL